jgi:uncharacterized membrane protein YbhN (UPF0104 family)
MTARKTGGARRAWIGYAIAAASLVWVFHDVSPSELWSGVRTMKPEWLIVAVAADVLAYLTQGWRWHRLLSAIGPVTAWQATQAVYAGLFLNELLPLRLGELLRIHLVARRLHNAYSAVASSVVVERFIDAVWLAAAFGVVVSLTPLPAFLLDAEEILAGIAFGGLAGLLLLAFVCARRAGRGEPSSQHWLLGKLQALGDSLALIGRSRGMLSAALASPGVLGFQSLAFYFAARSYGLPIGLWQILGAFLVQHVGNAVPGGPGNVGTYQLFVVLGLTIFGVDKALATGFSVVVFLVLTIPLWVIGSV